MLNFIEMYVFSKMQVEGASEDLINAFTDMMMALKQNKPELLADRETVATMVNAMLEGTSSELGFIQRVQPLMRIIDE